jgi:hypothetical protein
MRDRDITFGDAKKGIGEQPFQRAITNFKGFDFAAVDMVRIREEVHILITNLSMIYNRWKEATC